MAKNTLSVVLPCYNEAENIPGILKRFAQVRNNLPIELVLVDNGSTDDTSLVMRRELSRGEYGFARSLRVQKNRGYGYGILFGLRTCEEEFLAYSHADAQCDPADVVKAYLKILKSSNPKLALVKGERKRRFSVVSAIFSILACVLFLKRFNDINGQPKVFHSSFMEKLRSPPDDFTFDFYMQYAALKEGMKVVSIPVEFHPRKHGKSNWSTSIKSRIKTCFGFVEYLFKLRLSS